MHTAAECDGEMLKITADTDTLGKDFQGRSGRSSVLISELDVVVDPIHNRLHSSPTGKATPLEFDADQGPGGKRSSEL